MNKQGDFEQGKVQSLIMAQALPLTLAQLVQVIYSIVDRMYLGHMEGDEAGAALTGVGLAFPIITLIAAFTNLFSTGGAPLCSIARGKHDDALAAKTEANVFTMQILTGLLLAALSYIFMKPLLLLLGAGSTTFIYAKQYLDIYLAGTVFLTVSSGMNGFINLQGFPKTGMCTVVIGAVINLILDPIFIFGLKMGTAGAALATVISQAISCIWVVTFLFGKKAVISIKSKELFIPDIKLLGNITSLGLSGFVMAASNSAVQAVCNKMLSLYGGDVYIAVMTIINSVREMIGLPVMGITNGSQPVLSYNYGAKRYDRVKQGIRFTALAGFVYTILMWLLIMIFPMFFIKIFSPDAEIASAGKTPLLLYFMAFFMMSFQFAGQSSFISLGKSKQAIFFSVLRKVIIVIPLTLLLPLIPSLGVYGVFIAEPVSNTVGGLACFFTMYFTVYKKLGEDKPEAKGRSQL